MFFLQNDQSHEPSSLKTLSVSGTLISSFVVGVVVAILITVKAGPVGSFASAPAWTELSAIPIEIQSTSVFDGYHNRNTTSWLKQLNREKSTAVRSSDTFNLQVILSTTDFHITISITTAGSVALKSTHISFFFSFSLSPQQVATHVDNNYYTYTDLSQHTTHNCSENSDFDHSHKPN